MAYLEINDIHKTFDNTEVLKGVSFSIEKGEVVTIIGSSGSGKTTLLRSMNFLEKVDSGTMILDGQTLIDDNSKFDKPKVLREKALNTCLVFQSFNLFPQYTVLRNITLAPSLLLKDKIKEYKLELKNLSVTDKSLTRNVIKEKVNEFKNFKKTEIENEAKVLLEKIGLSDKANAYPCELSGGQCQRVAIARALAIKPKILCFDEPTSALDPELTGEVLKVIKSLKNEDRTMVIVTHEMGFAKNVSDKVIFLYEGQVEEIGSPKDVFDNPKSENLIHFLSSVNNKDGE